MVSGAKGLVENYVRLTGGETNVQPARSFISSNHAFRMFWSLRRLSAAMATSPIVMGPLSSMVLRFIFVIITVPAPFEPLR